MNAKHKLLLDTDIGGDLDDALALAYLLRQPRCELLGVTTVGGEAEKRAALASAICKAAGRADMPIHVGASAPILLDEKQPVAQQAEALSEQWPHLTFGLRNTAIGFLADTIRAYPHQITLLTIGPLTNIGLLFALEPDVVPLLAGMMVMGGSLLAESAHDEWNIYCDPHAAAKVFGSGLPLISVGVDVTGPCRLEREDFYRRLRHLGGPFDFVCAMAEVFFRDTDAVVFHDPYAAALIFEPALCATRSMRLEVELYDKAHLGRTRAVAEAADRPHRVAFGGDPEAFFEHYFAVAQA